MKNRDNYETREINLTYQDPYNPITYDDVEPFGWVETEVVTVGMSEYSILERNIKMPNYRRIKQLDEKYFELKNQKVREERFSLANFFTFLLFFIVPGLLYIAYKIYRKKAIRNYNNNIQKQMDDIVLEAYKLQKSEEEVVDINKTFEGKKDNIKQFLFSPVADVASICGSEVVDKYTNIDLDESNIDKVRDELFSLYLKAVAEPNVSKKMEKMEYANKMLQNQESSEQ